MINHEKIKKERIPKDSLLFLFYFKSSDDQASTASTSTTEA